MERIKQAIEKARVQHPGGVGRHAPHHLHSGQGATSKHHTTQASDNLEDINYKFTRVEMLRAEHLENNRIVAFNNDDPKSMVFDLLRTQILKKMEENDWRTLAITSPTPEAGKTVVAINLAMSIAKQTNKTTMLVDFDLRRPKIGSSLGITMEKSLNDLLDETAELSEVLVNPDIPRLVVLPTRNPVRNSSETLSSRKIADLIKDVREYYKSRIVIIDMPPLLITDDVIALLPQIDCVLMVVANGMSTHREIEDSLRQIPAEKLIGTVLNKATVEKRDYYYY